jgi:hypothetical protein
MLFGVSAPSLTIIVEQLRLGTDAKAHSRQMAAEEQDLDGLPRTQPS